MLCYMSRVLTCILTCLAAEKIALKGAKTAGCVYTLKERRKNAELKELLVLNQLAL